jgi:hypothetical protein
MWYWIFHSFTAAVCQAVLVIVAPSHPLSPAAFESMQAAVELFERAEGERAKSAAIRVGWLAAKANQTMEAYRNTQMQQPPAPSAGSPPPLKLAFPTSNIRGNPEELLGTSTKLIRAQPGDALSSPASLSGAPPPQLHPSPMSANSAAGFQFGSAADRQHDARRDDTGYPRQEQWTPALPPSLPPAGGAMDWAGPDFGYSPHGGGHSPLEHDLQPQFQRQVPFLDASAYLSVDGFDLSGFIQNGANAWLFDRAPELESEVGPQFLFGFLRAEQCRNYRLRLIGQSTCSKCMISLDKNKSEEFMALFSAVWRQDKADTWIPGYLVV